MTEEQSRGWAATLNMRGYLARPVNHYGTYGVKVYRGGTTRYLWTLDAVLAFAG